MLLKISLVLFLAWLLGVLGLYPIGSLHHALLLVGLMLMLLSVARARDAAMRGARQKSENSEEVPSEVSRSSSEKAVASSAMSSAIEIEKSAKAGKRTKTPAKIGRR